EYGAAVVTGAPQVAYRETITQKATFNYTHKKQTGGSGQYGRIAGGLEPAIEEDFVFDNKITGGAIPTNFIPACEKGFKECMAKGQLLGFPVTGVKVYINDGASHAVDSSDMAFQAAARGAFREAYPKAKPVILEPIMKLSVESPTEFQGAVMGTIVQRRGIILGSQDEGAMCRVEAEVPLSEMFGYSTVLRSATQGKAQFTMEFAIYRRVPGDVAERLVAQAKEAKGKSN
ncbi:MAG: elongation factor G, partial [Desulfatitalea sp.]|nr:elongation factor G [Desulfatitalea sp.]